MPSQGVFRVTIPSTLMCVSTLPWLVSGSDSRSYSLNSSLRRERFYSFQSSLNDLGSFTIRCPSENDRIANQRATHYLAKGTDMHKDLFASRFRKNKAEAFIIQPTN